jgi:electron transport complex protein RnfE
MGGLTTFVLFFSCLFISVLKNLIPEKAGIPAFLMITATFTTIAGMLLQIIAPEFISTLGIFIPLTAVSSLILEKGGATAYNSRVLTAVLDSLGMGIGFCLALLIMGCIREFFGNGSLFDVKIFSEDAKMLSWFLLPSGAFIIFGFLMVVFGFINEKNKTE